MRAGGGVAEGLPAPVLVLGEVPIEEGDFAVALEGKDVGRDPVEEPAVVGDDDDAAGGCKQRNCASLAPIPAVMADTDENMKLVNFAGPGNSSMRRGLRAHGVGRTLLEA